ncbi:hypothetical protein ACFTXB_20385 [Streptomyces sp. NPDC057074]|uniref:hypothetical protein n=1 Tax=Streptomyces sp. NPDC057074 TaxID=3346015 RepID=UPI00363E1514
MLSNVLDIKEDVYAGDFKVELSQGLTGKAAARVEEYVVTPQLRKNASYAAYLHGSFGAGKSHFLTVLHAVLNADPSVRTRRCFSDHVRSQMMSAARVTVPR